MEITFFICLIVCLLCILYIELKRFWRLRTRTMELKCHSAMGKDIQSYLDKVVLIQAKNEDDDASVYVMCIENIRVKSDCILFDTEFCLKDDTPKGGYSYFTYSPDRYYLLELECKSGARKDYHLAYIEYLKSLPLELSEILIVDETGRLKVKFA